MSTTDEVRDALATADDGYPVGWPRCAAGCGRAALDGHLTCGCVECDEGGCRNGRD